MCYVAYNIRKIEKLGGLDYINSFEHQKFKTESNRETFIMTVL